jgi:hypothetical protein
VCWSSGEEGVLLEEMICGESAVVGGLFELQLSSVMVPVRYDRISER